MNTHHSLSHRPHAASHRVSVQRGQQLGVVMLEALIAIMIFSIGVLGIVGLQARSVQGMGEAGYRSQAVQHASQLIAEMWTVDPGLRAANYASTPAGTRYTTWAARVTAGATSLPGAADNPPIVTVNTVQQPITMLPGQNFTFSNVTVTIRWLPPGAPAGTPVSQYTTTARMLEPQS